MKKLLYLLLLAFVSAHAWDSHFLLTHLALKNMQELNKKPAVAAESLSHFVNQEKERLIQVVMKNDLWLQNNITHYPPVPTNILTDFRKANADAKRDLFLQIIRVNPNLHYSLFVQYPPYEAHRIHANPLAKANVMLPTINHIAKSFVPDVSFESVKEGELLTPLEIIASAAEEPDYGMDINLWSNNHTWFGKRYEFGKQPFGNRHIDFSAQAPFHMGFYHEEPILYFLAPSIKNCLPLYRIHLYLELSKFAFASGHPYWGYRFLGWGLHYIQDLTQPYHARVAPNVPLVKLISANLMATVGFAKYKDETIQLLTNRHFSLEDYQYTYLLAMLKARNEKSPIITALIDQTKDAQYPPFSFSYVKDGIAYHSYLRGTRIDEVVRKAFPYRFTMDPQYVFYVSEPDIDLYQISLRYPNHHLVRLNTYLYELLAALGSHTRNVVREVMPM